MKGTKSPRPLTGQVDLPPSDQTQEPVTSQSCLLRFTFHTFHKYKSFYIHAQTCISQPDFLFTSTNSEMTHKHSFKTTHMLTLKLDTSHSPSLIQSKDTACEETQIMMQFAIKQM